jgi:ParB/RepB/Spo0J family partition protein
MISDDLAAVDFRDLSMGLIDPPDMATRQSMDPDLLRSLADSIAARGLHQPIGVERRAHRYAIMFGHRRFVAHQMLGRSTILARIYPEGYDHAIAIQADENDEREKVNPADYGDWLCELYERRCDKDLVKLCALVRRTESYVEPRLRLAVGDPAIKEAVREKAINMSVALILNTISDAGYRDYYTARAIEGGCNVRTAKFWKQQADMMAPSAPAEQLPTDAAPAAQQPNYAVHHQCCVCHGSHDVSQMEYVQVHKYCNQALLEPWAARQRESA